MTEEEKRKKRLEELEKKFYDLKQSITEEEIAQMVELQELAKETAQTSNK